MGMKTKIWMSLALVVLALSCGKTPSAEPLPVDLPSGLNVSGAGVEAGETFHAMTPVSEGVWDYYAEFTSGEKVRITRPDGSEWASLNVPSDKAGVCCLRVKAGEKAPKLIKINKVSLVVTEGGVDFPPAGNKPPIVAAYAGGGVWKAEGLYVMTDHIRYRYQLDTDSPADLKYWCAVWDNAGSAPVSLTPEYLQVRSLGQKEYDALYLKDNRACWMFPSDKTSKLTDCTVSMNVSVPVQEVTFYTAHKGPKAVFIGDSITWLWGLDHYDKKTPADMVYPIDPLPSWAKIVGSNIWLYFHKAFFDANNYSNKGISGNNTTQMVARYQQDVLNQDPQCVVIMGGTNDLAQGYTKNQILANLSKMAEQAEAADMKVILCSVTPCNDTYSKLSNPKTKGAHIVALNAMIKEYAESKGFIWCDYYPSLVAEDGFTLKECYWMYDHLHPNPDAYVVMEGIIKPIIEEVLK